MKKRALAYLIVSFSCLASFLLAVFALGFRESCGRWFTLDDINNYIQNNSQSDQMSFLQTGYSLMVLAFVLMSLAVIGSIIMFAFAYTRNTIRNKWDAYFWLQLAIIALTVSAFAFMLSGELVFMVRFFNYNFDNNIIDDNNNGNCPIDWNQVCFDQFWNTGYMAGMLIFTIIPLLIIWIPLFIKVRHQPQPSTGLNDKKKKGSPSPKPTNGETEIVELDVEVETETIIVETNPEVEQDEGFDCKPNSDIDGSPNCR
ncbi:hypothetical protein JN01_0459 [Entomoplasma freundtii]|uniref:Uncharacterized protein n=1 Tax=Entomoplasma freundtii TaxID=74700 RepID=A0A2K8NTR0_9MOLU|nr:hypothetical protein [Entomoplasma freundtii]ATZ16141.1 hypothetical protein EFREU_v1c01140 [Entomoplasma freundtii]TDY56958.1 hypothetical protein JN01_0459 [Entomoplasma freundtii]